MIEGPLVDEIRAASHFACRALETQILAAGHALKGRLKPAERRKLRATCDYVGRRVALWRELLGDEPEIVAGLETLAQRLQEFRPWRRPGNAQLDWHTKTPQAYPLAVDRRQTTV